MLPVDVWKKAAELGVTVLEGEWQGRPHAICLWPERVVILNSRRAIYQRRFDLAHELAHYVIGVEERHTAAANVWAAEMLMPAAIFVAVKHWDDRVLARRFGVSRQAVELRRRQV